MMASRNTSRKNVNGPRRSVYANMPLTHLIIGDASDQRRPPPTPAPGAAPGAAVCAFRENRYRSVRGGAKKKLRPSTRWTVCM